MNPIAASVARPYTVAVGVILVVIASWLAIARIPVQLKPTVDIPRISVTTSFRGASAAEVEEQVTRELEDARRALAARERDGSLGVARGSPGTIQSRHSAAGASTPW